METISYITKTQVYSLYFNEYSSYKTIEFNIVINKETDQSLRAPE